jgi:hypothetical protein
MWVFTTDGFVSAARWDRPDEHQGEVCLRARERATLERMRERNPALTEVVVTPDGDYRYRAWLPEHEFAALMAQLALEVDYPNFKSAVYRRQGASAYEGALHTVWSVLGRIQPLGPYGVGGERFPRAPRGEPRPRRRPWGVRLRG